MPPRAHGGAAALHLLPLTAGRARDRALTKSVSRPTPALYRQRQAAERRRRRFAAWPRRRLAPPMLSPVPVYGRNGSSARKTVVSPGGRPAQPSHRRQHEEGQGLHADRAHDRRRHHRILAAIAIPNFLRYQLRAKFGELPTNVSAIFKAEESLRQGERLPVAATGQFAPPAPGSTRPSRPPRPAARWRTTIDWMVQGGTVRPHAAIDWRPPGRHVRQGVTLARRARAGPHDLRHLGHRRRWHRFAGRRPSPPRWSPRRAWSTRLLRPRRVQTAPAKVDDTNCTGTPARERRQRPGHELLVRQRLLVSRFAARMRGRPARAGRPLSFRPNHALARPPPRPRRRASRRRRPP